MHSIRSDVYVCLKLSIFFTRHIMAHLNARNAFVSIFCAEISNLMLLFFFNTVHQQLHMGVTLATAVW